MAALSKYNSNIGQDILCLAQSV